MYMIKMENSGTGNGKMSVNNEIVRLLSYLRAAQWANILEEPGLNKEIIYELMRIQEEVYKMVLIENVEAVIESRKKLLEEGK